jgi:hypothetical protein
MQEDRQSRAAVRAAAAFMLDLLLIVLAAAIAILIVNGPAVYEPFGISLKLRTSSNPVTIALALALVRIWFFPAIRFLGFWKAPTALQGVYDTLTSFTSQPDGSARVRRFVVACVVITFAARAFQAWMYPGFAIGDDVEIDEMTLRALLKTEWPVWELRSAFYPFTFIYPAQAIAYALNGDVHHLVVAGRMVVVLLSTAAVWLTWIAARGIVGEGTAALAAAIVAFSRLHLTYGSSELPRPVAATLLVGAFALLSRRITSATAAAAGGLIGVAAAMRFSEALFLLPAALHVWFVGGRSQAALLAVTGGGVAAAITAAADLAYWGSAFHSVRNALDYTLLDQQSSRGFQPPYYYFSSLQAWTNWIVAGLACTAWRDRTLRPAVLWALLPIAILSALPHKEGRYLIPIVPFIAICAAAGITRAVRWTASSAAPRGREALVVTLAAAMLYEIGEWRLGRSNDAVALARFLRRTDATGGVAVEQMWRAGGSLYLSGRTLLLDMTEEEIPRQIASPDLTWLAVKVETVNRHGFEPALAAAGWRRHARFGGYDLFQRARP